MKARSESARQSLKAFIAATILIVVLLNMTLLLPVAPVHAESEGQTCTECSNLAETSHYVTVNIVDGEILLRIEPLSLPETSCGSCSGNQGCSSVSKPTNTQLTVLQQDKTQTVVLLTTEVDGTIFSFTITKTLLWNYEDLEDGTSRTANFTLVEIAGENVFIQFYKLNYQVQNAEYYLTTSTILTPLNSETYNTSYTTMNYAPAGKSDFTSLEFVAFNPSVTLSQNYAVLSTVADKIGNIYENNEALKPLARRYHTIRNEAKHLSKLVEKLPEYNREILHIVGILMDYGWWECMIASIICGAAIGVVVGCAIATLGVGFIACLAVVFGISSGAVWVAIATGAGVIGSCVIFCCCMGYQPCCF